MKTSVPRSGKALSWVVLFGAATAVLTLDQVTKVLVMTHLAVGETWDPIPALADYFSITRSINTGAALGILPWAGLLFLIVALGMIVGIVVFYPRIPAGHWLERIALGLLLGGAAGNALDRIRLGYVVDFVHFQLKPIISNVSNFADHAIVIAILVLFINQWNTNKAPKTDQGDPASDQPIDDTPPVAQK